MSDDILSVNEIRESLDMPPIRPFEELRDSGLLWLINKVVFHPRGYALALHYEGKLPDLGKCTGWSLQGDGSETWIFSHPTPEQRRLGVKTEDESFALIKELLK